MKNTGFSLIELMVIIVILGILAFTVVPYAQYYIDETRISKAKNDLAELRNAIIRFEHERERPYTETTMSELIGTFINRGMVDPWGMEYIIDPNRSVVYSLGPDRRDGTGLEIRDYYRPALAITRAFYSSKDEGELTLRVTRPLNFAPADISSEGIIRNNVIKVDDFIFEPSNESPASITHAILQNASMTLRLFLTEGDNIIPGNTYVSTSDQSDVLKDYDNIPLRPEQSVLIRRR